MANTATACVWMSRLFRLHHSFPVLLTFSSPLSLFNSVPKGHWKPPRGSFINTLHTRKSSWTIVIVLQTPPPTHTHTLIHSLSHTHLHAHTPTHRQGHRENVGGPRGKASGGRYSSNTFQQKGEREERARGDKRQSGKPLQHWESCSWF